MDLYVLIPQLIVGALGGNIIGALFKNISLGFLGNTLAGLVGGGAIGPVLGALGINLAADADPSNLPSFLPAIGASAGGGGIVMLIVGYVKSMLNK